MPKKPAVSDTEQVPSPEDRPLHAPAFDVPVPAPDEPPVADDTDTEEK